MSLSLVSDLALRRIVEGEGLVAEKSKFILKEYYDYIALNLQDLQTKKHFWDFLLRREGRSIINRVCGIRVPGIHQKRIVKIFVYGKENQVRCQRLAGLIHATLGMPAEVTLQDSSKIYA